MIKFDFLSPGVNIREIDNSILPAEAIEAGPILIGRTRRGPALQPVRIRSYEDFVDVFGAPVLGSAGSTDDIWRAGFVQGPQYAAVAAQAHLASQTTPVTFVRLLGDENPNSAITGITPGWTLAGSPNEAAASNSTAYGLFLINSGAANTAQTGSLAAVFYANSGFLTLSGTIAGDVTDITSSVGCLISSQGSSKEFKIGVFNSSGDNLETISFNFDRSDNSKYIRNQFSTNPVQTNSTLVGTTNQKTYWLGETFDRFIADTVTNTGANGNVYGVLYALESGSVNWSDHAEVHKKARSGDVIAQDQGAASQFDPIASNTKLFYFESLHGGSDVQNNTLIAITNITLPINNSVSSFSQFDVQVRDIGGSILEEFRNLDLNPQSDNYIVKRIGDTVQTWNETTRRYDVTGDEPNLSNYFRVVVSNIVRDGSAAGLAPFGFLGPIRPKGFTIISGSTDVFPEGTNNEEDDAFVGAFVQQGVPASVGHGKIAHVPTTAYTASFVFPKLALRANGAEGNPPDQLEVMYGIRPTETSATSTIDNGYVDYVRRLAEGVNNYAPDAAGDFEHSFCFTLDDVVVDTTLRTTTYTSGSRRSGTSFSATDGAASLLDNDVQQFIMPVWGGFDGLDITEKEPFRNTILGDGSSNTTATNYTLYSMFKALDSIRDSEQVIANTLSVPGVTESKVTDKVISICESRKDLLGIIDQEGGYVPETEQENRALGVVSTVITNVKARKFNSSFACTFYPWVQIQANTGFDSGKIWAPASVAAIGAFANSERQSELWFAPAGFTRGGLNPLGGVGGPGVINVDGVLTAKQRDKLYQVNVNPIASFPGEGIVVFGQKTLQATPSALDRINVRRLLIYLKGELSRISRGLLFEPNVNATWLSFKSQADQVLSEVKANFGVTDYKVVLDETTTTADLIDRNILYAKVFIKPTRAIEYIVVDLIVTNTGAEFV